MDESLASVIKSLLAGAASIGIHSTTGEVPIAAVPDGVSIVSLEQFMEAPRDIRGTTTLYRYDDFVAYVKDFKSSATRIFVQPKLSLANDHVLARAYLDYPEPDMPSWTCHQAELVAAPSLEYGLLTTLAEDGLMDQAKFALRLRDVARFCTSHASADLVEIARSLTLSSKGKFSNIEDDFSGSVRFGYEVKVTARSDSTTRKNVEVPREVTFELPVLMGGQPATIGAELLYRTPNGSDESVKMGIRLPDREFVERQVLEQVAESLGKATETTVAMGFTHVPREPGATR